jgi:diguanylate cyclase (GGDEF)-like protein
MQTTPQNTNAPRKSFKLLIVDDDDVDREKFRRLLRGSDLVANIEEASSGRDAIARMHSDHFDCVIVDYRLGDTTGTELVRSIKEAIEYPIPIIMVTGCGDEEVAVVAMREGVYDYLTKNHLSSPIVESAIHGALRWGELETELVTSQERLKRLSLFDSLTNLPNRNLFFDRLEQTLQAAKRNEASFSLMMMDLNLFKEINDALGHAAGDQLLAEIGRRLSQLARASDTFARIGGDEFAAVLVGCDSASCAVVVAEKIHAALNEAMTIDNESVRVTASIGVALFPGHGTDMRTLLAHADQAMYRAKRSSCVCEVYSTEGGETRSFLIACHLPEALAGGELFLEYQPKLDLGTGALAGVEALVRWRHPRLGLVSPNDFICIAERTSLIKPMTYAILGMALDQAALWRDQGWGVPMAVNLSARVVDDGELATRTCEALEARRLRPEDLTFEVTETALMTSPLRAQSNLRSLHEAGIAISIDDFGTGYTSLKYLRDFEISEIKIDKVFITGLVPGSRDAAIVRAIAALSGGFKVKLVAEGIEDESQCGLLHELGCDFGQGFALGRPMSARQFEAWRLARDRPDAEQRLSFPASGTHARRITVAAEAGRPEVVPQKTSFAK